MIRCALHVVMALAACAGAASGQQADAGRAPESDSGPGAPRRVTRGCVVTRIVDGDTLVCRGVGSVRLIGVDAPERTQRPFGAAARDALAALAPPGDSVHLEPDVQQRDRYGRTLAYVWRNGRMVNWRMIRDGWAMLYTVPPNVQWTDEFATAQRNAREARRGLWAVDAFACSPAEHRRRRC